MTDPVVELRDVSLHYRVPGRGRVHALDSVDLSVAPGRVLGLVGESGCGKSSVARVLTGLERVDGGAVLIDGVDVSRATRTQQRAARRVVQMVFQDPYASLDPRQPIGSAIGEVLTSHRLVADTRQVPSRVTELLEHVGLPAALADRLPHQISGGQRQRVGIARALAVQPRVVVLDEPVSALDVSVRAEIINLLLSLRRDLGLSYIFISHDLAMVRHLCDDIAVMYLGRIVETGTWQEVADTPVHPYTRALLAAVPEARWIPRSERSDGGIAGEVADAAQLPSGCRFHPRCELAVASCASLDPLLRVVGGRHAVACPVAAP